jgi:hypothetical protein
MSYNVLDKLTYTLVLNSSDKVSGTNNNATFNINWAAFLPMKYSYYKVIFNFQTIGGNYKDGTYGGTYTVFSTAKVTTNLQGSTFSYDSSTNSGTNVLGLLQRDIQTTTSYSNTLNCFFYQNASKTIVRPSSNLFTISIYNNYLVNTLFVDTTVNGTLLYPDMSAWTAMLEFIPIYDSKTI